jgi:hypothetical protein
MVTTTTAAAAIAAQTRNSNQPWKKLFPNAHCFSVQKQTQRVKTYRLGMRNR